MSKYLEFKEIPFKGKTKRFEVISKSNETILGRIQWYSQWRQYVFMPGYPTIWNRDCMEDIIFFINNLMEERKIILTGTSTGRLQTKQPNISNTPKSK